MRFALWSLAVLFLLALLAPLFSGHDAFAIHLEWKNSAPSSRFLWGTDELGRDLFTRIWWGARISLFVGVAAALIDMAIGVFVGALAAYAGGKVDEAIMRFCDILYSIPYVLVVILLTVIGGSGLGTMLLAMTLTGWINMARITRAQAMLIKQSDYVAAAKSLGASHLRILLVHIIPNAISPIIATMTLTIPAAIFTEAFCSFLGLGVQAPVASLGVLLNDGLSALRYYPWRMFMPALVLTWTILSFNILGNQLRDKLDPRLAR